MTLHSLQAQWKWRKNVKNQCFHGNGHARLLLTAQKYSAIHLWTSAGAVTLLLYETMWEWFCVGLRISTPYTYERQHHTAISSTRNIIIIIVVDFLWKLIYLLHVLQYAANKHFCIYSLTHWQISLTQVPTRLEVIQEIHFIRILMIEYQLQHSLFHSFEEKMKFSPFVCSNPFPGMFLRPLKSWWLVCILNNKLFTRNYIITRNRELVKSDSVRFSIW